jgi:predicted lipoprotein with Yx(FWY)xxD motif
MRTRLMIGAGAMALALAACGGYGSDDSSDEADSESLSTAESPAEEAPDGDQAAAAPVTEGETSLGTVLADTEGLTLYGFTDDTEGISTCNDACADAWPPLIVDGAELPAGLDPSVFTVVERADGTNQLKAGEFPLYRFAGDSAPGDVNGQGSGGVWFVAAPDGSLVQGAPSDSAATETDGEY